MDAPQHPKLDRGEARALIESGQCADSRAHEHDATHLDASLQGGR